MRILTDRRLGRHLRIGQHQAVACPQPITRRASHAGKAAFVSVAALALAACGSGAEETIDAVKQEASAPAEQSQTLHALDTAIDEQALEGLARGAIDGAVNQAIGEVLPAEEIATVRAVVDEEAIAKSLRSTLESATDARTREETAAQ
jgi:hypothetical protein